MFENLIKKAQHLVHWRSENQKRQQLHYTTMMLDAVDETVRQKQLIYIFRNQSAAAESDVETLIRFRGKDDARPGNSNGVFIIRLPTRLKHLCGYMQYVDCHFKDKISIYEYSYTTVRNRLFRIVQLFCNANPFVFLSIQFLLALNGILSYNGFTPWAWNGWVFAGLTILMLAGYATASILFTSFINRNFYKEHTD